MVSGWHGYLTRSKGFAQTIEGGIGMSKGPKDLSKQSYKELCEKQKEKNTEKGWENRKGKTLSDDLRRAEGREQWGELMGMR